MTEHRRPADPRLQAVFLDAGGVLIMPDIDELSAAFARVGLKADPEAFDRAHYMGVQAWDRLGATPAEPGWRAYASAVAAAVGCDRERLPAAADALLHVFATSAIWRQVRADSMAALPALRAAGLRLAVVSNSDGTVEQVLRAGAICQVGAGSGTEVMAVLDSHVVGAAKPDRRIFELALAAVGVAADEAVHVGDSTWADVAGARAAGIRPLHFDPHGICPDRSHEHLALLADLIPAAGKAL